MTLTYISLRMEIRMATTSISKDVHVIINPQWPIGKSIDTIYGKSLGLNHKNLTFLECECTLFFLPSFSIKLHNNN